VLGPRWRDCVAAIERHIAVGTPAESILGALDAMKYRSSREIFER